MKIAAQLMLVIFVAVLITIGVMLIPGLFGGAGKGTSGMLRSSDGGKTWVSTGTLEKERETDKEKNIDTIGILDLQKHPKDESILFIGSQGMGLFKSDNGGALWYRVHDENNVVADNADVQRIAISRKDPDIMYVSIVQNGKQYVARSIDGGRTFFQVYIAATDTERIYALGCDAFDTALVYMITNNGLFLKTYDGGGSWRFVEKLSVGARDIIVSRINDLFMIGLDGSVRKSADQGTTWTEINTKGVLAGGKGNMLAFFAIDRNFDTTLYIGSGNKVYRSYDDGVNWQPLNLIVKTEKVNVSSFAQDPQQPHILYVGAGSKLYKSTDAGESWSVYHVHDSEKPFQYLWVKESDTQELVAVFSNGR